MSPETRWAAILDRFEADIAVAVSGGTPQPWVPATDPGPLPPELLERAARVLDAQRETLTILVSTRQDAAEHLEALKAVPGSRGSGHPLLLDALG